MKWDSPKPMKWPAPFPTDEDEMELVTNCNDGAYSDFNAALFDQEVVVREGARVATEPDGLEGWDQR